MDECEQVQRLLWDGRCFLVFSCPFPDLPKNAAGERIRKYLTEAKSTVFSCAEAALPEIARRYRENPDPKKAFRQRPFLLALEFSVEEKKRAYRITRVLRLSRLGRTLSERVAVACFDKRTGYLLGARGEERKNKDRREK